MKYYILQYKRNREEKSIQFAQRVFEEGVEGGEFRLFGGRVGSRAKEYDKRNQKTVDKEPKCKWITISTNCGFSITFNELYLQQ